MKQTNRIAKSIRLALAFGATSTLLSTGAYAQDTAPQDEDAQAEEKAEKITVVGSRIRTDGLENSTPIEIISTEIAVDQGLTTLGELLRTSTIASGSNQLTAAMSVGNVTAGGAGNESISMRGLGSNRTLVLLNGRRAGPAGTRGQVAAFDMNSIPVSAVERVEILKDGASSLYGSDAIAGVINIITKRGDESAINFSANQPTESGGENYRLNGTYGQAFDRGSYRLVADYRLQKEMARGDRDHFACGQRYLFDAETGERADPIDPRTNDYHCNDLPYGMWLWDAGAGNYTSTIQNYDYDGLRAAAGLPTYDPQQPGDIAAPDGWYPVGYSRETDGWLDADHPFQDLQTMVPRTESWSIYGQVEYDLTDSISMYGELLHSVRETKINSYRQFWEPFIPAWAGLVDGWDGYVYLDPTAVTDHSGSTTTIDYTRGVLGLEGSLGFWTWDVSWQRSLNSGTYDTKIIYQDALEMAANAVWGDPCEGELTPISKRECYAIDFWDPEYVRGNFDQGTRDFLFGMDFGKTIYKQDAIDAYMTGDLFDLPAGTVATAFGVAYQTDEIVDTPGEATLSQNSWGMTSAGITAGRQSTKAAYVEFQVPLLRDLPAVKQFDLTTSARWTDVNTYGSDTTYKLGINWAINDDLRVRASRGTSFRSPALFELYLGDQSSFFDQRSDPCWNWAERVENGTINPTVLENCQADGIPGDYAQDFGSGTAYTGGGAGSLKAETSVYEGVGVVWTSPENTFAASVDYYKVTIENQVDDITGVDILNQCYLSENFEDEPFCDRFTRNDGTETGNWGIDEVYGGYVNIASQFVRGIDVVASYQDDTPVGFLRLRVDHTIQIERASQQFADSEVLDSVGLLGSPRHSGTLTASLERDDWRYTWATRYLSSVENYERFTRGNLTTYRGSDVTFIADAPSTFYHTASVSKTFEDNLDVTLGVTNIFDKKPPYGSPSAASTVGNAMLYSQYDQLGRQVFLNVMYNF
ncbi:TonB-dependent receptor [Pseudidiomarina sediminum]|uniref:TonB-dependent receptor n=1 Tax=Pseudidiomarina sediminum TaxID=431675 RepID=A0A432ZB38_9GAMM|nr:TonB-dependent receptor [Pseudidiomarina sediminum]RUO75155.1 TonB-dependent receptor [Pseudidiomarina sediminum]